MIIQASPEVLQNAIGGSRGIDGTAGRRGGDETYGGKYGNRDFHKTFHDAMITITENDSQQCVSRRRFFQWLDKSPTYNSPHAKNIQPMEESAH